MTMLLFTLRAESPPTVSLFGVTLQTEVQFSAPQKVGLDAFSLVYPAAAKPDAVGLEIILVRMDAEMQQQMGGADRELLEYGKTVFLGITGKPKESIMRQFAGKPVKGELHESAIPRPSRAEIYLISLKNGAKLMISFRSFAKMKAGEAEGITSQAAKTFKESDS